MAKKTFVLAIDQGTTGTHVCVVDSNLRVVGRAYKEFRQQFPKASWVEHDLSEIWRTVEFCVGSALRKAHVSPKKVAAIGITNQRETTGIWRRTNGKPLHNAIVWQDRRTADLCQRLKDRGEEQGVRMRTGLVLDPYFSGTKLAWLLDHVHDARKLADHGELCFGTIDTWLVFKLTGGAVHVTDASNASRTLLMDLARLSWDDSLRSLFGVPLEVLPRIASSSEVYGTTKGVKGLPDGIPIAGIAGDQQAALFGQACFEPGETKCTYGTGAFLLMNVGEKPIFSSSGLLSTVAWRMGDQTTYALEGSAFIAGAAVQWLRDGLGIIKQASDIEKLAGKVDDAGDVVFVPALAGLGAPRWRPNARGLFWGMDRSTTMAHLARAVLEGIALQVFDLADAMRRDSRRDIPAFKVDGGASANPLLMQFQADILGAPVVRPKNLEATGLGAAMLAGLAVGVWKSTDEIRRSWKVDKVFKPAMAQAERERRFARWRKAVERA